MSHANEVAVITGGQQGLGYNIAQRLASEGATVVLFDLNAEKLAAASRKISGSSFQVINVTDEKSVAAAFANVVSQYGRLDILVQAAGITGKTGITTDQVDADNFDLVFAVNTKGVFLCCKHALPQMVKQDYGRIVNIASVSGKDGNAKMLAYSGSKAAVIGITKVIGKEFAETGITVNALAPAVVKTAMVAALPDDRVKYMTNKIPMKRCGTVEEIAALVSFIAHKDASFTTGFTFDATGGRATY